jgi:lipid-binding SYLF domain-containing protein
MVAMAVAVVIAIYPFHRACAATAKEIDVSVDAALDRFVKEVKGANEFLKAAKGFLVVPKVIQGGLIVGAEYGEGALRIDKKTVDYYSLVSGSIGYQIGAEKKDIILVFMEQAALDKFRSSENWRGGVDAKITVVNMGVDDSLDSMKFKQPIIGIVFGQRGLMAGATLEGSKFSKLKK